MDNKKIKFYNSALDIYKMKGVPSHIVDELFKMILQDMQKVSFEDYDIFHQGHIDLLRRAEMFYVDLEDFKHAAVVKKTIDSFMKFLQDRGSMISDNQEIQKLKDNDGTK